MTVTISGTDGITTPGLTNTGTETLVNLTTTGNTTLGDASTDTLNVGNGGLIKDASGNVGVGVTPSAWNSTEKAVQIINTSFGGGVFASGSNIGTLVGSNVYWSSAGYKRINAVASSVIQFADGQSRFLTAATGAADSAITFTSAMTLDASGNLLVGTTSATSGGATCKEVVYISNFATTTGISVQGGTNNAGTFFQTVNYAGTINGSITQTNASTVAYNTTSDYRLKENIQPMTGALAKVQALNPVVYKWKSDGSDGQGFIAHELQAVVPDCVVGEKDSVDANGNPKYQGIDTSFLVATLTAAIKEQSVLITTLTDRITALENK